MYFEGSQWDDTLIGQFYDRVRSAFPEKRQKEMQQEARVRVTPAGEAAAVVRRSPPRMQFVTATGERMIQLGRDLLVVNQLRPYSRFEEWEESLYWALAHYVELAHPKLLTRLGVRYIDRVIVPSSRVEMREYFALYPTIPPGIGMEHGAFMVRVEFPERRPGHRLLVTFGSAPPEDPNTTEFLLDYYDKCEPTVLPTKETVQPCVCTAHDIVVEAFEASLTDRLRALFEPEDSA